MSNSDNLVTAEELANIPPVHLPLAVLSYNYRSMLATLINIFRKSDYNHFMWMHRPGFFATQDLWYREVPISKYTGSNRLALWYNPEWTLFERAKITREIKKWLAKPPFSTRYDWIALIGQAIGLGRAIQNPLTRICSDYGSFLKLVDSNYNLKNPAPDQVEKFFKKYPDKYKIYCRYITD